MKRQTVLLLLILIAHCYNNSLNAQWFEKTNGLPPNWYSYGIDAYDSLIAVGPRTADSIYITTNGGNIWYSRPQPEYFLHFSIIGKDKIWGSSMQKIYVTFDGGFKWQLQFYDTSQTKHIYYLEMFDSLNGIAMGNATSSAKPALVLKTTNGGEDWISQNDSCLIGIENSEIRVDFANPELGYLSGSDRATNVSKLYKTDDGGKDWKLMFNDYWSFPRAYDSNIALCYSVSHIIYRTTDKGYSWQLFNAPTNYHPNGIVFTPGNPSNVWSPSFSSLFFSSDTGRTWIVDYASPDYLFDGIDFTDSNYGWLLARDFPYDYKIFRTTNGGHGGIVSVNDDRSNAIISNFILAQNFPNPFNPSTKIRYSVPQMSKVIIKVFDVLGNEIETLVNEEKPAGIYELTWFAERLPSGVYFYQLKTNKYIETKKMILLR